jgi:hypothetical protein
MNHGRQPATDLPQRRQNPSAPATTNWSPATAVPSPRHDTDIASAQQLPAQNPVADSMEDWSR